VERGTVLRFTGKMIKRKNMRKEPSKKKKGNNNLLSIVLFMFLGAACGILIMLYWEHAEGTGMSLSGQILAIGALIIGMYAAMLLQIIIHEAGHLVFGLLTGYKFSSFRIFNLMLLKEDGRLRFRKLSIAGTGGQCLMCPPDLKDGKMPYMLYNFGGAIMNILAAVLSLALCFILQSYSAGWAFCAILAVIGLGYALINGLPVKMGPVNNDGRNAFDMVASEEAVRAFWVQLKINEMVSKGVRLKDMPESWFTVPSDESMKNGITAASAVFACNRLMDMHRFSEADALMARILSPEIGLIDLYRMMLVCDRMYVELISVNRPGIIEGMRTSDQLKLMKSMKNNPSVLRTEYAYALLTEKNVAKAREIEKQFEKSSKSYPYPNEIEAERELLLIANEIAEDAEVSNRD